MDKKINQRFLICLNDLILKGKIKDRADFVNKVKKSKLSLSHLSLISTGKRSITIGHLFFMCKIFGISANYIILGIGPKYLSEKKTDKLLDLEDRVIELENKLL